MGLTSKLLTVPGPAGVVCMPGNAAERRSTLWCTNEAR